MHFLKVSIKYAVIIGLFFYLSYLIVAPALENSLIIASNESTFLLEPSNLKFYYLWSDKHIQSAFGGYSGLQANIFFFSFFWEIFESLTQEVHPSVIFIFLSYFLPALLCFVVLDKLLKYKNKLIYLPAALLYSFNMFRINKRVEHIELNLLFILLPVFFLYYYRLIKYKKSGYIVYLTLLSILASTMGGNLAVGSIPYILLGLYLIYFLLLAQKSEKEGVINKNILLIVLLVFANLFWITSLGTLLKTRYEEKNQSIWSALDSGNVFDHFRLMGGWSFRSNDRGVPYFPYADNYFDLPLLFSTYLITILTFVFVLNFHRLKEREKYFGGFALLTILFSLFLVLGTKGPLGFIYNFLFNNLPGFVIYREPYAKFMPLYIFASSIGLSISLKLITGGKKKNLILPLVSLLVLLNAYPLFSNNALFINRWSNGNAGSYKKIPEYWKEAALYLESDSDDFRTLIFPYRNYLNQYNWEYGGPLLGDAADFLIRKPIVKAWKREKSELNPVLEEIVATTSEHVNFEKYLGFLGIKYVLQENDTEWRYQDSISPPSENIQKLSNLQHRANFGLFDSAYLATITNLEESKEKREEFENELSGQPAISIYETNKDFFIPHFYIPHESILVGGDQGKLLDVIDIRNPGQDDRIQYIFGEGSSNNAYNLEEPNTIGDQIVLFGEEVINESDKFNHGRNSWIGEITWNEGWDWPGDIKLSRSYIYPVLRMLEIIEIRPMKHNLDKSNLLLWHAAKRSRVLSRDDIKDSYRKKLGDELIEYTDKSISLFKSEISTNRTVSESERYWGLSLKIYSFLDRYSEELSTSDKNTELVKSVDEILREYSEWVRNELDFSSIEQQHLFSFTVPESGEYELLVDTGESIWEPQDKISINTLGFQTINIAEDLCALEQAPIIQEISSERVPILDWKPNKQHILKIQNSSPEMPYTFSIVATRKHIETETTKNYLPQEIVLLEETKTNDNKCFDTCEYEYVYKTPLEDPQEFDLTLKLFGTKVNDISRIIQNIQSINVVNVCDLNVALRTTKEPPKTSSKPKITYVKINPTKYILRITDIEEEFTLVFNERYNDQWKMYHQYKNTKGLGKLLAQITKPFGVKASSLNIESTTETHLNGDVLEGVHQDTFIDSRTFETWGQKPLTTNSHYEVNGYANAWIISPENLDNKEEVDLILEFWPQRLFYIGFSIALFILLSCVLFIIIVNVVNLKKGVR